MIVVRRALETRIERMRRKDAPVRSVWWGPRSRSVRCWRRRGESQHTENLRLLPDAVQVRHGSLDAHEGVPALRGVEVRVVSRRAPGAQCCLLSKGLWVGGPALGERVLDHGDDEVMPPLPRVSVERDTGVVHLAKLVLQRIAQRRFEIRAELGVIITAARHGGGLNGRKRAKSRECKGEKARASSVPARRRTGRTASADRRRIERKNACARRERGHVLWGCG
ncbi:hypothetical protein DMC30DRAFT_398401 [Rhodotorula diobovata]|uniref:Uncharacterized protein n=1 Tax=Rhodotorula diobovata TaxID=5288 RepID=A0A5C5FVD0_9BASI|nr:hypothetical protein DMC30DRAFT_398401 [Rhodotorula diobovata]